MGVMLDATQSYVAKNITDWGYCYVVNPQLDSITHEYFAAA